jgi:hypothetical protein
LSDAELVELAISWGKAPDPYYITVITASRRVLQYQLDVGRGGNCLLREEHVIRYDGDIDASGGF